MLSLGVFMKNKRTGSGTSHVRLIGKGLELYIKKLEELRTYSSSASKTYAVKLLLDELHDIRSITFNRRVIDFIEAYPPGVMIPIIDDKGKDVLINRFSYVHKKKIGTELPHNPAVFTHRELIPQKISLHGMDVFITMIMEGRLEETEFIFPYWYKIK